MPEQDGSIKFAGGSVPYRLSGRYGAELDTLVVRRDTLEYAVALDLGDLRWNAPSDQLKILRWLVKRGLPKWVATGSWMGESGIDGFRGLWISKE